MKHTSSPPPPFWPSSGWDLLERLPGGRLRATPAFLARLFRRPELAPAAESCAAERALHRRLLADPAAPVSEAALAALADPDARDNYRAALAFRELLLAHPDLESAYRELTGGATRHPRAAPLTDLLVQALLGALLGAGADPFRLRAAELLFRTQRASLDQGVLLADAMTLDRRRDPGGPTLLQALIRQAGGPVPGLDVLGPDNALGYRRRSEDFDMALSLAPGGPGMEGLCRVLEDWVAHFHGLEVGISPLRRIDDPQWRWHIGLDAESSRLLDGLYRGEAPAPERLARLLALFRLDFAEPDRVLPAVAGRPVYLGLAVDGRRLLRLKPQNLLFNLPLREDRRCCG